MNEDKENQTFEKEIERIEERYGSNIVPIAEGGEILIPDNQYVLEILTLEIRRANQSYDQQLFGEAIADLGKRIGNVPTVMNVRHHLAPWSMGIIITALVASLITCTSVYFAITYHAENRILTKDARKYGYVEMLYPAVASLINYEIDYKPGKLDQRVTDARDKTYNSKKTKSSTNLKSNEK